MTCEYLFQKPMPCLAVHHWHHSFTKLPSIEKWFLKAGNVSCDDGHSDLPLSQSDKAIADTWWHLASFSKILPPAAPKQDTLCLHCHREACTWHFFFSLENPCASSYAFARQGTDNCHEECQSSRWREHDSHIANLKGNPGRCVAQAHRKWNTEKLTVLKKYT